MDIICHVENYKKFISIIQKHFSNKKGFELNVNKKEGTIVARFQGSFFPIEIFGQNIPTEKQNAFRHMLIEHQILIRKGKDFKNKIIELKLQGYKTEPAFAQLLGLEGDPYQALLEYQNN